MKTLTLLTGVGFLIFGASLRAEELTLGDIWKEISGKSHVQSAARFDAQVAEATKERTSRHWLPRVYVGANSYFTNDPAASFFGLIEQRSISQSDFLADAVNNPDSKYFTKGTLGIDLLLFEGGLKVSENQMQTHLFSAKEKEFEKIRIEQYSEVVKIYGSLVILISQKEKLFQLAKTLERLIKNYQFGSRSNPVGYSGLLGMKSLANRLLGLMKQYAGQGEASINALKEMGFEKNQNWNPQVMGVVTFIDKYLHIESLQNSFNIESLIEKSKAAEQISGMERARFLPKIGVFAESYVFNGNRATANGYTSGVYLQWSLFNPGDYGALREAQLREGAARHYSLAAGEKERAEYQSFLSSAKSLRENLALLEDSQKLMTEQAQVAETLFRNGSINALQFVEVLSRKADLIVSQTETELGLVQIESQKTLRTKFVIPQEVEGP